MLSKGVFHSKCNNDQRMDMTPLGLRAS